MPHASILRALGLALALAAVRGSPSPASPTIVVETYGDPQQGGSLTFSVDGKAPCTAKVPTAEGLHRICSLPLPEGTRRLRVTGDVSWRYDGRARRARGVALVDVVDVGPLLAPLRIPSLPFGRRVELFLAAHESLKAAHPELAELAGVSLERRDPVSGAQIAEAERRLGFPLPEEHASLLRTVGALAIDDSAFTEISELARADHQMVHAWGTPKDAFEAETSAQDRAVFRDGTILFTEVGDGLGGLIYLPRGPSPCGGGPAYFWYHQESGHDAELLTIAGSRCRSYEEALRWLLASQVLVRYQDESEGVLVDSSAPGETRVRCLVRGGDRDVFKVDLEADWDGTE